MPTKDRKPAKRAPAKELNPMQQAFVRALSRDARANGTRAAIAAGYSPKNAAKMAHELLHSPAYAHVQRAYEQLLSARLAKFELEERDILRGLAELATGDWRRILEGGPGKTLRLRVDLDELWPEEMRLIKSMKALPIAQFGEGAVSVTFYSRQEALVALAKIKGLMRERHEHLIDLRISEAAEAVTSRVADLLARRKAARAKEIRPSATTLR